MTAILTTAAVLALAASCQAVVSPATIAKIAKHESGLNPAAVNRNTDGTLDVGLMQINSANFGWLGLTMAAALDPCRSIAAGAEVLTAFSRYNTGSPTKGIANGYALAVQAIRVDMRAQPPRDKTEPLDPLTRPTAGRRDLLVSNR